MARGGLFAIYVDGFLFLFRDGVMVTMELTNSSIDIQNKYTICCINYLGP